MKYSAIVRINLIRKPMTLSNKLKKLSVFSVQPSAENRRTKFHLTVDLFALIT